MRPGNKSKGPEPFGPGPRPFFEANRRYGVTFSVFAQDASICFTTASGNGT